MKPLMFLIAFIASLILSGCGGSDNNNQTTEDNNTTEPNSLTDNDTNYDSSKSPQAV